MSFVSFDDVSARHVQRSKSNWDVFGVLLHDSFLSQIAIICTSTTLTHASTTAFSFIHSNIHFLAEGRIRSDVEQLQNLDEIAEKTIEG